jgi:hypothetical protein
MMALIAFSPPRGLPLQDLQAGERLIATLSSSFSTLAPDDVAETVTRTLEMVGQAFAADECTLVSYGEPGAVSVAGAWAAPPHRPCGEDDLAEMPWLLQRVARNTVVALTAGTDFPQAAARDREHAVRTGVAARLAVPVALGARVAYALMLGRRERHADWAAPIVDRLRLAGEIPAMPWPRRRRTSTRKCATRPTPNRSSARAVRSASR